MLREVTESGAPRYSPLQWASFVVYGLASTGVAELPNSTAPGTTAGLDGSAIQPARTRSSSEVQYAVTGPASVVREVTTFSLEAWAMVEDQIDRFERTLRRLREQGDREHAHKLDGPERRLRWIVLCVRGDQRWR